MWSIIYVSRLMAIVKGCDVMVMAVLARCYIFFFNQKTAYELRMSDWSSDVCASDLAADRALARARFDGGRSCRGFQSSPLVACGGQQIGRASCRERVCQYV